MYTDNDNKIMAKKADTSCTLILANRAGHYYRNSSTKTKLTTSEAKVQNLHGLEDLQEG